MQLQYTIDPNTEIKEETEEIIEFQTTDTTQSDEYVWDNSQGDLIYF